MSKEAPYNPLAKENLGESVANALLGREVRALSHTDHLGGAGIYAIYYVGIFSPYIPVGAANVNKPFSQPIYVGKAVPKGARKGGLGFDAGKGRALRDRLRQHAASIEQAGNLNLEDFHYRALTVEDIWIPLGENVVIEKYQPLWNRVIDGFGNKDPGNRRATQYRSSWDVLHPGRAFAEKLAIGPVSVASIELRVMNFFAGQLPESDKLPLAGDAEIEDDDSPQAGIFP
ncbi:Eco29kI family restriction endonuclease [Lysobacter capsici]|uniref:Eco29kI family restriction endonuclease n=1 Tax=Lysobacter capsici TaxID=435897 RepID=UPI00069B316C|nr:Eco29kI family restriction endonuclease [Lysobacter capsici]